MKKTWRRINKADIGNILDNKRKIVSSSIFSQDRTPNKAVIVEVE
jgi:hypothetical protein